MPIRPDKRNIPILRVGIEQYIEKEETAGKKDLNNTRSVLLGAKSRVVGKTAAGPAFAQSEFGGLRMDRLTAHDFTRMFKARMPDNLAPATRKRGMSNMAGFIEDGIAQGYLDERVRTAVVTIADSPPRSEWLHPPQVTALGELITVDDEFSSYDEFAVDTYFALGIRTFEGPGLQPTSLDQRTKMVTVIGKGRGVGKPRKIPVDAAFVERWQEHVRTHAIPRRGYMLYQRLYPVRGGAQPHTELVVDKRLPTSEKSIRTLFHRLQDAADAQLSEELAPSFTLTPKVARRTFACTQLILHRLGLGGLDLHALQMALGHESLQTTQIYLADVNEYLNLIEKPLNTLDGARLIVETLDKRKTA